VADKYIYDEENNKANKVVNDYNVLHDTLHIRFRVLE